MGCAAVTLTSGVQIALACPPATAPSEPRPVDLTSIPGAELLASQAWTLPGDGELQLSCASLPISMWLEGLEGAVLSGASALVRDTAGLSSLTAGALTRRGERFEQPFEGEAADAHARGKHVFGFVDEGALLCTAVCVGPAESCDVEVAVSGAFQPAPQSSWLMRGVQQAAAHPHLSLGSASALVLACVALLLSRRPRPRW